MRGAGVALALAALALPASAGGAGGTYRASTPRPLRVMSLNMCTDQLVLELLPPERITSVTWLSRESGSSLLSREAMQVGVNHGLAEEVLRQRPDLVIAGEYTTPAVRGMLKRLNFPVIEVASANSVADIRTITRQVATAVGERQRGEALLHEMDQRLGMLARDPAPKVRLAAWDRSGFGSGAGTLQNEIFEIAGGTNLAAQPPISGFGRPEVEQLLVAAPPLLVQGSPFVRAPSLGDDLEQHRLVRRFWTSDGRMLSVPQAYYICGTPRIAEAAESLRAQLSRAAPVAAKPLPFQSRALP